MVPNIAVYLLQFNCTSVICLHTVKMINVLFLTIQFSICHLFAHILNSQSSIGGKDRAHQELPPRVREDLRAMATTKHSMFLRAPLTGASPSDCLMSYPKHSLEESYSFADMQSVYFTVPADWARETLNSN